MSVNAKLRNHMLFQNKPHQKPIMKSLNTNILGKNVSSKVITNPCKTSRNINLKSKVLFHEKNPLKTINENDKNYKNIEQIEVQEDEKEQNHILQNLIKDDLDLEMNSDPSQNVNEKNQKPKPAKENLSHTTLDIDPANLEIEKEFKLTDTNTNQDAKNLNAETKSTSSKNLDNLIINMSLMKKNDFPNDEYREMFSKLVRDDYSVSIINSLLQDEIVNENYMAGHKITERMRVRMVDWMIEVLSNYRCDESTFFESVNLMDRYFKVCQGKNRSLMPEELHLIGVTSMFIASKYQDIYPLRLRIIHEKIAHRKLSCAEIRNKEEEITKFLNYSIGLPTMWDFINLFIEEIFYVDFNHHHISSKVLMDSYYDKEDMDNEINNKENEYILNKLYTKNMINLLNYVCIYLAKMNCHDYNLMQKKPSLLAAGTIYVAIKICEQINKEDYINDYFINKLNYISQKSESDIIKTAQKILYNAQNFDTLFNGLENLKKVHFNAIIELKNTK